PDASGGHLESVDPQRPARAKNRPLDVIFPIAHGRGGEDGSVQGLFELASIPYVGSGVLSSAIQMDKDFAKRLLQSAGLPVLPWVTIHRGELSERGAREWAEDITKQLALPVFVKPANSGSSIGISKATRVASLTASLEEAVRFDDKVIVERAVEAREIEIAILGNESCKASLPGEIVPKHGFYDYQAKYQDEATELIIPADIPPALTEKLQDLSIRAAKTLEARGMTRVDFLIEEKNQNVWINELNSLPGFTSGSMYPRLWAATGVPFSKLLDQLIELAIEQHAQRVRLQTAAPPASL
ncbi:D-alanine--D-alanine ligase, partial [Myxococcota bacterium]|nr:D-alanine--D-alanine ligase [Myxococcota bacterium]